MVQLRTVYGDFTMFSFHGENYPITGPHMMNYPKRAWEIYREDGLGRLASQTKHFLRERLVPFRLEIRCRHKLNQLRYGNVPHPLTVYWIDPHEVEHVILDVGLTRRFDIGKVRGGDWDLESFPVSSWRVYRGLKQRFEEGKDWEETEYYQMGCDKIRKNGRAWNCTSPSEFLEQRCRYVDGLYESIEQNGYRRSTELEARKEDPGRKRDVTTRHIKTHEISIAIDRNGSLILAQGIHRYCISRLLEIDKIPVQVLVRHKEWQQVRNETHKSNILPADINASHPDLQDLLDS